MIYKPQIKMKKSNLLNNAILALVLLSSLIVACKKDNSESVEQGKAVTNTPLKGSLPQNGTLSQTAQLYSTNGPRYKYFGPTCLCCIDLRGNCIGDIIINGTTDGLKPGEILVYTTDNQSDIDNWYEELDQHIELNTVADFFAPNANGRKLLPHIDGQALEDLLAGTTTIVKWQNSKYLILYPEASSPTDCPTYED